MISVLHCIGKPVKGGLERIVVNLTSQNILYDDSINFYILSLGGSKKNENNFYKNTIIDFFLNFNFIYLFVFLKKKKINIVHCHTLKSFLIFIILKPLFNYKIIHHIHTYKLFNYWFFPYTIFLLKKADTRVVVNEDLQLKLNKWNLSSIIIYNGISDNSIISLSKININKSNSIRIGYVGRLESEKYVLELGKLVYSLGLNISSLKLYIFGSGTLRATLEDDLTSKRLNYEIIENEDELEKIYNNFEILIVPSKLETFSLVTLEALIANKLVLTRDQISYNIFKQYFAENITLLSNKNNINLKKYKYNYCEILRTFSLTRQQEKIINLYKILLQEYV